GTSFGVGFAREKNSRTVIGPTIRSAARLRSVSAGASPRAAARSSARGSGWRGRGTTGANTPHAHGVWGSPPARAITTAPGGARDYRAERRRDECLEVAAQHPLEVVDEVARVGFFERRQLRERLDHERELRGPAPVDRRLPDPGAARDPLDGESRIADLHEQLERGVEDRAVRLFAARSPRAGRGRGLGAHAHLGGVPILYVSLLNSPRYPGWTSPDSTCMLRARGRGVPDERPQPRSRDRGGGSALGRARVPGRPGAARAAGGAREGRQEPGDGRRLRVPGDHLRGARARAAAGPGGRR